MNPKLKKALKIAGIIAGAMAVVVIIGAIFVPGLPLYIKHRNSFPSADVVLADSSEFRALRLSGETQTVEKNGVFADIPAHFTLERAVGMFDIYTHGEGNREELLSFGAVSHFDFDFTVLLNDGDEKYFRALGIDLPQTSFELNRAIWSITSDDFTMRNRTAARAYVEFAELKEEFVSMYDEHFLFENDYVRGFVYINRRPDTTTGFLADLYLVSDENSGFLFALNVNDDETAWAIFNSIRI
jgi:hypothetical protein